MAKHPRRKILTTILSITSLIILLLGIAGLTAGKSFMALVGRDKTHIRSEVEAAHQTRQGSSEILAQAKNLEKTLGRFQEISNIMGMANMEDVMSGKNEYSYYAYCQFEKGIGTYIFRINNDVETPKTVSVTSEPRHLKRKRVRQEIFNQLR